MKNIYFLITVLCVSLHIDCSVASITLDQGSEAKLLEYAWSKALAKKLWPRDSTVTLKSFSCVNQDDSSKSQALEYKATFYARYARPVVYEGQMKMAVMCTPVTAEISEATLKKHNIVVPNMRSVLQ